MCAPLRPPSGYRESPGITCQLSSDGDPAGWPMERIDGVSKCLGERLQRAQWFLEHVLGSYCMPGMNHGIYSSQPPPWIVSVITPRLLGVIVSHRVEQGHQLARGRAEMAGHSGPTLPLPRGTTRCPAWATRCMGW